MTIVAINLKADLKQQVEQFSEQLDLSMEKAVTELLQRAADIRKLRALRKKGREYAEQANVKSEEDIYEAVQEWRRSK